MGREVTHSHDSPSHLDCETVLRSCWWNFKHDDSEQIDPSCLYIMSSKWGLLLPRDSVFWELVALKYLSIGRV